MDSLGVLRVNTQILLGIQNCIFPTEVELKWAKVTVYQPGAEALAVVLIQPFLMTTARWWPRSICAAPLVRPGNECWQSHCALNACSTQHAGWSVALWCHRSACVVSEGLKVSLNELSPVWNLLFFISVARATVPPCQCNNATLGL